MTSPTDREAELAGALAALTDRLAAAARAAGRDIDEIDLLPITKFFPATDVAILWRLGCRVFGESREQEASAKIAEVADLTGVSDLRWHMVGQIQRNKAKAVAAWADTVHSLSTTKVAAALDRGAALAIEEGVRSAPINVFVQISLDGDTSRGGVDIGDPAAVDELCALVAEAGGLRLAGLMAVPPLGADPDAAFAALADEHRRILRNHPAATALSAGMSGDLEAAVRHGSTCVRVGTALMGQRPLTSP
ncbi:YggS family pyridoxal phosphate-dependent enzyme [Mycolicibacterium rhodesiae]|uniref:Pyridoxal phosphate homeostasis protein n=1 Tax=Mycolicibacterium rhodesiae TaxID=36814 RepID=A0A1X0IJZ0_MYCRH|nr:YggS family pyridoxal phosphate-dependent enzyme [Mycolicibacterium rhodesiae]MCV7346340.1 YggS family pyridoxal phosphate-dependent enzyme [Mycolicibacterium rhodesiae]ORB48120.1 YggS family pyridoxal phosphate enzyme [Mycolicibacterium rhodesiae]